MVDDGTYIKNADIAALVGTNAGTTAKATATTDVYVKNVEAWINVITHYDWTTNWASLDATQKTLLTLCGAAKCAQIVVNADPTGYPAREAETTLDFLNSTFEDTLKVLRDKDAVAAIVDGL